MNKLFYYDTVAETWRAVTGVDGAINVRGDGDAVSAVDARVDDLETALAALTVRVEALENA